MPNSSYLTGKGCVQKVVSSVSSRGSKVNEAKRKVTRPVTRHAARFRRKRSVRKPDLAVRAPGADLASPVRLAPPAITATASVVRNRSSSVCCAKTRGCRSRRTQAILVWSFPARFFQPACLVHLQSAIFLVPATVGLPRDRGFLARLRGHHSIRNRHFHLPQQLHDLFRLIELPRHFLSSFCTSFSLSFTGS